MSLIIMKFGGTSVADLDCIRKVADRIEEERAAGYEIVVTVSAMAGTTNELVKYAGSFAAIPDGREYDTVVAAGEQVTSGLLTLALQERNIPARSWLAWQIPIKTDESHTKARINHIDPSNLEDCILNGQVPVVAGFQGLSPNGRVTTLGRGGSDTSAVALAAALGAVRCDIFTDVEGVYTSDPRIVTQARKLEKITYEEMLEMASLGAKVLQTRSVELAMNLSLIHI